MYIDTMSEARRSRRRLRRGVVATLRLCLIDLDRVILEPRRLVSWSFGEAVNAYLGIRPPIAPDESLVKMVELLRQRCQELECAP